MYSKVVLTTRVHLASLSTSIFHNERLQPNVESVKQYPYVQVLRLPLSSGPQLASYEWGDHDARLPKDCDALQ